jgi:beta-glucosidase
MVGKETTDKGKLIMIVNKLNLMKKIFLIALVLAGFRIFAQDKIEYNLCDQDFRPVYMHENLPSGAVYTNKKAKAEDRAKDVIARLNFDEKLMLTGGWNNMHYPGIPRLGIPPVYFADASQGIHLKELCVKAEKSTAFPSTIALAATWNPDLAYSYARDLSEECRAWGINVLLGPGLNMYRNSEGGRNFEYLGEDPFLTSRLAVSYVKGLQSLGTIATLKHFLGNEHEFSRHVVDINIEERALNEIYLRPFLDAIEKGGALAVMTGNNFVNGYPGAADQPLSGNVLRERIGYKGIIMSDWASSQFWPERQNLELSSGHSLLMDNNTIFAKYITEEIAAHPEKKVSIEKDLEKMIFYNLYTFFKGGVYDRPYRNPSLVSKIESHKKTALKTAEEGITLLKNEDNILPVLADKTKKIIVLGKEEALNVYTGKGSGNVAGYDHINYLEGLRKVYGDKISRQDTENENEIRDADAVIYFINKAAGEGFDVPYELQDIEGNITRYADLNKNLIIVYSGGNGLPMPWLSKVKGLIFAWLLGQERGNALANIISGRVNPSGKLPFTIEKKFSDSPAFDYNKMKDGNYYWKGGKGDSRQIFNKFGLLPVAYKEGIYMGYRWFDKMKIEPQFPFGFGLSYTDFSFSNIKSSASVLTKKTKIDITFTLKNTGKFEGAEVAQLYVRDLNPKIDKPLKELKGFQKIFLKAGESKTVTLPIFPDDLACWDIQKHKWRIDEGDYLIEIGNSSTSIKQEMKINYSF